MLRNKIILLGGILLVILIGAGIKIEKSRSSAKHPESATYTVKRSPLTISITETGTIKAREQIILKNEVEGRTSIIFLIPEGTLVKKGDLLVQLDSSTLEDNQLDQEIRVQNAEASFINSSENLAVVKNQAKSDIDLAQLTLEFAKQDLQKYIEGEYPNEIQKADAEITLAEERLTRAFETLKWSKKLNEEKYLSDTERQADELSWKEKELNLELAKNNRDLLKDYTYHRKLAQLTSDVTQAEMALERITRRANANVIQAEAELKAKEAEYLRQKDRLQKIIDQISKTKIYSPTDALVIYATSAQSGGFRGNVTPLEEGQDVRERQELIYLPTASSSKAEISIHESNLEKVYRGLPAVVTVDALPGMTFYGKIAQIAPLPDAQRMWLNPDLKVYPSEIHIENNGSSLRTGMSCQAEIIIAQYPEALYVPVQAVLRVDGAPTVHVKTKNGFEPRVIKTGLDNNAMIHVLEGLQEGESVLLTPPLQAGSNTEKQTELPDHLTPDKREGTPQGPTQAPMPQADVPDASSVPKQAPTEAAPEAQGRRTRPDDSGQKSQERGGASLMTEGLTAEERQAVQNMLEKMPEEQREAIRRQLEVMTPEQRKALREQFRNAAGN